MIKKKKILVIGTGGTIACKYSDAGLVPVMTAEELITHVPYAAELCHIETLQILNIDSTDIRPEHWLDMAKTVKENYDDYDGFVICHGTDTLAYTGAALSYLIRNPDKPIVITGAQKPIDAADTDARRNLSDSIIYAGDDNSAGVVIVFDGKVIAGTRAKKERSKSYNAFSSINFPNLAVIRDGRIIHYIAGKNPLQGSACASEPRSPGDENHDGDPGPRFYEHMSDRVMVLKLTPGISAELLPELFKKYDCIILESFGVGGIPSHLMEAFRREMEAGDTLVIMATQVAEEGSDMAVYQVGRRVKYDFDLLETFDMTLEAAFAKACWLMGEKEAMNIGSEEIKSLFYGPVNHDITVDVSGLRSLKTVPV